MTRAQKKAAKSTWSPAARKKRLATLAAKRAAREALKGDLKDTELRMKHAGLRDGVMKDLVVFLEHAERAILKSGAKRISKAESYAMLALTTLRGG